MLTFADIIKDSPTVADVHATSALGNLSVLNDGTMRRRRRKRPPPQMPKIYPPIVKHDDDASVTFYVPISKTNDELRTVYGWATVNSEAGKMVTDHQDDQISDEEMTKAAHDFVTASRLGGLLHALKSDGNPHEGGGVVESIVLTQDLQKALGIDLGKTGWFVGYRVTDPDAWTLVKDGTLKAFSIGGRARRVPVEE
jgi:hypothetical protein